MKLHALLPLASSATELDGSAMLQMRLAPTKAVPEGFAMTTEEGCVCRRSWNLKGFSPTPTCTSFCCNPDQEKADWCFIEKTDPCFKGLKGKSWGYCPATPKLVPVALPRKTKDGCTCKRSWGIANHPRCETSCCNPDNEPADWCMTEEGCPKNWGFCAAEEPHPASAAATPAASAAGSPRPSTERRRPSIARRRPSSLRRRPSPRPAPATPEAPATPAEPALQPPQQIHVSEASPQPMVIAPQEAAAPTPEAPAGYKRAWSEKGDAAMCDSSKRIEASCGNCGPNWGGMDKCKQLCDDEETCSHFTWFGDQGCQISTGCDTTQLHGWEVRSWIFERLNMPERLPPPTQPIEVTPHTNGECTPGDEKVTAPGPGGCQQCSCDQSGQWSCSCKIRVRKELHDMTDAEWERFAKAVNILRGRKVDPTPEEKRQGHKTMDVWKMIALAHLNSHGTHGTVAFLPWHRRLILDVETMLQEAVGSCDLTYPYWNWADEGKDAQDSAVFRPERLGKLKQCPNGECNWQGKCVEDGSFGSSNPNSNFTKTNSDEHSNFGCVKRKGPREGRSLAPSNFEEILEELDADWMDTTNYHKMSSKIERQYHNGVHGAISGAMGSYQSPYDPIFFMHHGFMDYLWNTWQHKHLNDANREHRIQDQIPRALQKEPRARLDGKLPEGFASLSDFFPASEMANAQLIDDDDPATDRHEYACVTWQEVQFEDRNDPCFGRTAQINSCMKTLFEAGKLSHLPRIDSDDCDPVSPEHLANDERWLQSMVNDGHITSEQKDEAMKKTTAGLQDTEQHLPSAVKAKDACEAHKCFSVSALIEKCENER